ncbi:MAG: transporter [Nitrospirota bacterium]
MMKARVAGLPALLFVLTAAQWLVCPVSRGEEQDWMTSLSIGYSTGTYGTDSPTSILSVPMTIRRLFADGDLSLTVPFVSVTGDCRVTLVNGLPNRTGGTCPRRTVTILGRSRTFTLPAVVNNQGLGDIVLQGRYYVLEEDELAPMVAITARVKFPTANNEIGLGTGEFDEGGGIEMSKEILPDWLVFADAGFTVIGQPEGVTLRNQWIYDLGLGYYVTDAFFVSVSYEEWRAIISGLPNPRDVLVGANYRVASAFRVNVSTTVGLSDGAPDYGLTGGVSIRF